MHMGDGPTKATLNDRPKVKKSSKLKEKKGNYSPSPKHASHIICAKITP